jgi:hypothetical protein
VVAAGGSLIGEDGAGVCAVCAKALALKDDIRIDVDANNRARKDIKRVRPYKTKNPVDALPRQAGETNQSTSRLGAGLDVAKVAAMVSSDGMTSR